MAAEADAKLSGFMAYMAEAQSSPGIKVANIPNMESEKAKADRFSWDEPLLIMGGVAANTLKGHKVGVLAGAQPAPLRA